MGGGGLFTGLKTKPSDFTPGGNRRNPLAISGGLPIKQGFGISNIGIAW